MESYRPLYRIITEHEYFEERPCISLQCCLSAQGKELARQRGLLFHPVAANEWEVLYDTAGRGVDTVNDVLELELSMLDPEFVLYTDWKDFCPSAAYVLELPLATEEKDAASAIRLSGGKRKVGSPFCTIYLHLTEKLVAAAEAKVPEVCRLRFHNPKRYWEYVFLPRNNDNNVPTGEWQLEDAAGKTVFGKLRQTQVYGREAWCTESLEEISMRFTYGCRLRLVVQDAKGSPKRIIVSQIRPPDPGRFQSKSTDCLRQVCYY